MTVNSKNHTLPRRMVRQDDLKMADYLNGRLRREFEGPIPACAGSMGPGGLPGGSLKFPIMRSPYLSRLPHAYSRSGHRPRAGFEL